MAKEKDFENIPFYFKYAFEVVGLDSAAAFAAMDSSELSQVHAALEEAMVSSDMLPENSDIKTQLISDAARFHQKLESFKIPIGHKFILKRLHQLFSTQTASTNVLTKEMCSNPSVTNTHEKQVLLLAAKYFHQHIEMTGERNLAAPSVQQKGDRWFIQCPYCKVDCKAIVDSDGVKATNFKRHLGKHVAGSSSNTASLDVSLKTPTIGVPPASNIEDDERMDETFNEPPAVILHESPSNEVSTQANNQTAVSEVRRNVIETLTKKRQGERSGVDVSCVSI